MPLSFLVANGIFFDTPEEESEDEEEETMYPTSNFYPSHESRRLSEKLTCKI